MKLFLSAILFTFALATSAQQLSKDHTPLPNTKPLTLQGDIASHLVAGVDRFLLKQLQASINTRANKFDFTQTQNNIPTLAPNRQRLAHILGLRDTRHQNIQLQLAGNTLKPALIAEADHYKIYSVRWNAFNDVQGEGLLLEPNHPPRANIIALPDCEITPEQYVGLAPGLPTHSQYPRRMANAGYRVIIPMLINRSEKMKNLSHREWLYRSAFELGRGLVAYEIQKTLALVDHFKQYHPKLQIHLTGHGDGGMIALYTAALDTRIDNTAISGYFGNRQTLYQQPIDRNIFGLLNEFGDAELLKMILPRPVSLHATNHPTISIPGGRGAPAIIPSPSLDQIKSELKRVNLINPKGQLTHKNLTLSTSKQIISFGTHRNNEFPIAEAKTALTIHHTGIDTAARHARQVHQLDRHNQQLLKESPYVRKQFYKPDTSSLEKFEQSNEKYRTHFYEKTIGRFNLKLLPANPRTRKTYDTEKWTGYEVVLDVFDDVIAYGILLVPKDIKPNQKRPVVVCQHGLEGRPQHVIGKENHHYYKAFAAQLADRGFVTFAPQNLYIFQDRFRTLQRKANPIGKTLFSVIVPQHQQIVDWLQTLPFVDPDRIGFYGLSYGGKSAMRIPPLVKEYKLSICSADFNEWVDKNASSRSPYSYVRTGEYEIFEFDLGSTFNYAEMAGLIAPRPFMVERGHFDGVAPDETVAYEFAKVRHLYQAKLGIGDRTEIEWFVGPHSINGKATFNFLHKHLNWPLPH